MWPHEHVENRRQEKTKAVLRRFYSSDYLSKQIISSNIKEEIERDHQENERRRRDNYLRQRVEEATINRLGKKIKKASRRKAKKVQAKNRDSEPAGRKSDLNLFDVSFSDSKKVMSNPFDNCKQRGSQDNIQNNERDIFPSDHPCQQERMTLKIKWEKTEKNQEQLNTQCEPLEPTTPHLLKPLTLVTLPVAVGRNFAHRRYLHNKCPLPLYTYGNTKSGKTLWPCNYKLNINSNLFTIGKPKEETSECSDSPRASVSYFCSPCSSLTCFYHPHKHSSHTDISTHLVCSLPSDNLQLERCLRRCISVNDSSEYFSRTETASPSSDYEILVKYTCSTQTLQQQMIKVKLKDLDSSQEITTFAPIKNHYLNIREVWSLPPALMNSPGRAFEFDEGNRLMECGLVSTSKYELRPNKMGELADNNCGMPPQTCTTNDYHRLQSCSEVLILNKDVESPRNATLTQPVMFVFTDDSAELIHVSEISDSDGSYCLCTTDGDRSATSKNTDTSNSSSGVGVSLIDKSEISKDSSLPVKHGFVLDFKRLYSYEDVDGLFSDEDDDGLNNSNEACSVSSSTFSSTSSSEELCTDARTENNIDRKFKQEQTFLGVKGNKRHVNPQEVVNNLAIGKPERVMTAKAIVSDSINDNIMTAKAIVSDSINDNMTAKVNASDSINNNIMTANAIVFDSTNDNIMVTKAIVFDSTNDNIMTAKTIVSDSTNDNIMMAKVNASDSINNNIMTAKAIVSDSINDNIMMAKVNVSDSTNNIMTEKNIVSDSINDNFMSIWDIVELGKAIPINLQNTSMLEIERQQQDNNKTSRMLKEASVIKDVSCEGAMRKRLDLNSSYCCPVNLLNDHISANLMPIKEAEVLSNVQEMYKNDTEILDYVFPIHNSRGDPEVVNACKDQHVVDMKSDRTLYDSYQRALNLASQEPNNITTAGIAEIKVYRYDNTFPCGIHQKIKKSPLRVMPHNKFCNPPPGLAWPTTEWPASQQLLNSSLPADKHSITTQTISNCSEPIASNNLVTSPNLNLNMHTKLHQLFLLLCDLQAKIIMLASTMKPFGTVNSPFAGASNCTILEKTLKNTGTLASEKELTFEQIEAILDKLSKTRQCQNRKPENTCILTTHEINKVHQKGLADIEQKNILQRSAEPKFIFPKEQKTTHKDKRPLNLKLKNMISDKHFNVILQNVPPAPSEEENWSDGIPTEFDELSFSQTEDTCKEFYTPIGTSSNFSLEAHIASKRTAELDKNKRSPCKTLTDNLHSSGGRKEFSLYKPAWIPEKFPDNQELNHNILGMSSQTCGSRPQNSATAKKVSQSYAYAIAVLSDFKKIKSNDFNLRLPPPSQRPVLSVSKRMPKITSNFDPEDV